jgi:DnaJ-class molecular chaperone
MFGGTIPGDHANPYDILALRPPTSSRNIKIAYRRVALRTHPDKRDGDSGEFIKAKWALDELATDRGRDKWASLWKSNQEDETPFKNLHTYRGVKTQDATRLQHAMHEVDADVKIKVGFCDSYTGKTCQAQITSAVRCFCTSQTGARAQSGRAADALQLIGCSACEFTGFVERTLTQKIYAPRGVFNGHLATVPHGGDKLTVRFEVDQPRNASANPFFVTRKNNDLLFYLKKPLSFRDALSITTVKLQKPCSRWLAAPTNNLLLHNLTRNQPSRPGEYLSALRMRGHGFESVDKHFGTGHIWIICKLDAGATNEDTPATVLQTLGEPHDETAATLESANIPLDDEDEEQAPGDCVVS